MAAKRVSKHLFHIILLLIALAFIIKFAGPNLLKQYISYGIGDCRSTPILCMEPEGKIFTPQINNEYVDRLIPYEFPKMSVRAPKDFTLVQELIKKRYRKNKHANNKAVIYLLIQEPGAFLRLYPDVAKQGIKDNYEFISRVMYGNLNQIKNIQDAFYVVMKSVFTPDVGNQSTAKMIRFQLPEHKGFINYTMAKPNNYFDCNVSDAAGNFFKMYIKDVGASLDLNNVFAIISTLKPVN